MGTNTERSARVAHERLGRRAAGWLGPALMLIATAWLLPGTPAEARTKLRVKATPATVNPGGAVRISVTGTSRKRCTLTVRADRAGARTSVRRRVSRRSRLVIAATSAPGRRVVRVKCGGRSASVRFTVAAPAPAPAPAPPAPEPEDVYGELPIDPADIAGLTVGDGVGGDGFSTRIPFSTGFRVRVSQSEGGGVSHSKASTRYAVDLAAASGTVVRAGFTGVVAAAIGGCPTPTEPKKCNNGWGNFVLLKNVDGTCAIHAHLIAINVSRGQIVPRYTQLGTVGSTGNSSGAHLHYDRLDCVSRTSLPWSFEEAGKPAEGAFIVSGNDPAPAGAAPTPAPTPAPTAAPPVSTPAPPPPSVSAGKGGSAQGRPGCSSSACRYLVVNWANFHGGGHTVRCHASHGDEGGFYTYTVSGASGSSAVCYYGYSGRTVWATVDGVRSGNVGW